MNTIHAREEVYEPILHHNLQQKKITLLNKIRYSFHAYKERTKVREINIKPSSNSNNLGPPLKRYHPTNHVNIQA